MALTKMQRLALSRLAFANNHHGGAVAAHEVRCRIVWYAADVLDRLVARGLVAREGKGSGAGYTITEAGRNAMRGPR